jgi:hypothetical protein
VSSNGRLWTLAHRAFRLGEAIKLYISAALLVPGRFVWPSRGVYSRSYLRGGSRSLEVCTKICFGLGNVSMKIVRPIYGGILARSYRSQGATDAPGVIERAKPTLVATTTISFQGCRVNLLEYCYQRYYTANQCVGLIEIYRVTRRHSFPTY